MLLKVQFWLWYLEPLVDVLIVALMIRRRAVRDYRVFFSYVVFQLFHFAVNFTASRISYVLYFWTYWFMQVAELVLTLGVIQELYFKAFRDLSRLKKFSDGLFVVTVLSMVGLVIGIMTITPGSEKNRLMAGLFGLSRSAGFVLLGLVLVLVAIRKVLGMVWPCFDRAIAWGMGIAAASQAIGFTVRAYKGKAYDDLISLSIMVVYDIALMIWVTGLFRQHQEREQQDAVTNELLRSLSGGMTTAVGRVHRHE